MFVEIANHFDLLIAEHRGTIIEDFRKTESGFVSAVFTHALAIQKNDHFCGGLALKQEAAHATLHVFIHRKICANGAISTTFLEEKKIASPEELTDWMPTALKHISKHRLEKQRWRFRLLLNQPIDNERLAYATEMVRRKLETAKVPKRRLFSKLIPGMRRTPGIERLRELMERERNRPVHARINGQARGLTNFDLVNAITDLVHDVASPALKWELMKLGGSFLDAWTREPRRKRVVQKSKIDSTRRKEQVVRPGKETLEIV